MQAWNWNATDSKKNIFDLIIQRYFPKWQSKEMSHDFVRGQSVLFQPLAGLRTRAPFKNSI